MDSEAKDVQKFDKKQFTFPKIILLIQNERERDLIVKPALERLGLLGREDIWIVLTGTGKVNSAVTVTMMLNTVNVLFPDKYKDTIFINVGTCSGNALAMNTVAQIDYVIDNEIDLGRVQGVPNKPAIQLTVTSEKGGYTCFTQDHPCIDIGELPKGDRPYYVDQELFSLANACTVFGVRCVGLKSVCRLVGVESRPDTPFSYESDVYLKACGRASTALTEFLSSSSDVVLN